MDTEKHRWEFSRERQWARNIRVHWRSFAVEPNRSGSSRGRAGALADDQFSRQPLASGGFAAQQPEHEFHRSCPQAELWLANGRQRHAKMFRDEHIAESND